MDGVDLLGIYGNLGMDGMGFESLRSAQRISFNLGDTLYI